MKQYWWTKHYLWDPEWSHIIFLNNPNDISSTANATVSVHKDYLKVTPLTTDTTPSNYNTLFNDRASNNSLNSTFMSTQETLNGTRSLTHQEIQTRSHFMNDELVEITPKTTTEHFSYSPNTHNTT